MNMKAQKGLSTASPKNEAPDASDWESEDHYNTLMKAEHIKNDPVKMEKVRAIAGRKLKAATAINSLADVKLAGKRMRKEARMKKMGMVDDKDGDMV